MPNPLHRLSSIRVYASHTPIQAFFSHARSGPLTAAPSYHLIAVPVLVIN